MLGDGNVYSHSRGDHMTLEQANQLEGDGRGV
jgi:hypothetical protein